jgi:hypothetical protein
LRRSEWRNASRRSEEFVFRAKTQDVSSRSTEQRPNDLAKEADNLAISNATLLLGDVIATTKGMLEFIGRNEQQPGDLRQALGERAR